MTVRILLGDVREKLADLPDESVHCVVTSPPYFGLRDYGVAGQIGLEPTPAEFVAVMVEVFREVRRVLRSDGTLWLNLGDSYANDTKWGGSTSGKHVTALQGNSGIGRRRQNTGLKSKDMMGIPWRVAFALQADGWYLRQDIIWSKPNPMPESVTDRCTKAHEYLFLLTRSPRYHYDAEAIAEASVTEWEIDQKNRQQRVQATGGAISGGTGETISSGDTRNCRSVWTVATAPFSGAHFAVFPPDLIEPCIKAGCPKDCCAACGAPVVREVEKSRTFESGSGRAGNMPVGKNGANLQGGGETGDIRRGPVVHVETTGWLPSCTCDAGTVPGTVLDPFGGAGTTGLVADRLQRNAILIELNPEYATMAKDRLEGDAPLFAEITL